MTAQPTTSSPPPHGYGMCTPLGHPSEGATTVWVSDGSVTFYGPHGGVLSQTFTGRRMR